MERLRFLAEDRSEDSRVFETAREAADALDAAEEAMRCLGLRIGDHGIGCVAWRSPSECDCRVAENTVRVTAAYDRLFRALYPENQHKDDPA